ncbi:mynd finger [Colletotrichum kahawae]|uniref:Mynd finger n=1 Tax=Colletotrichum kahawae TaxID=34407 RepID=A0AAD9YNZ1_COLKA|nr:mynd finger [Colletotrichum kahawae]
MASGGLYPTPTPSWFTLADRHHLERVLDVSGYSGNKTADTLDEEARRNLIEIDYHLFQDGLPDYFDRSKRYDRQPGDPLDRMFAELPTPADDEKVISPDVKLEKGVADYNRRFVLAIWPYANSSLPRVVQLSSDPNAHDYWWLTRFAFSLHERSDLSIRCTFRQLLGQLAASGTVPVSPAPVAADEISVPDAYPASSSSNEATELPNKQSWLRYTRWIYQGRHDEDSDNRLHQVAASTKLNDLNELLDVNKCAFCHVRCADSPNRLRHCSGCHVEAFSYMRRAYCSEKCQKADWSNNHYYSCQKRKHFLRAVDMLRSVAQKFQSFTYSELFTDAGVAMNADGRGDMPATEDQAAIMTTKNSRLVFSSRVAASGLWLGREGLDWKACLKTANPDVKRKLLAWDATDNIYYHLQGLIYLILAPHCDAIVEMTVLTRNAGWIASTAGDLSRETDEFHTSKGKDPMFWPRPILSCHIRGVSTEEGVYVIDLLGSKVGHEHLVLPYDAYVKSRHVSCLSSVPLYPTERWIPHRYPIEQKGLVVTRDSIAEALRSSIMKYFAQHWAEMKGPGHLAKLKKEPYDVYVKHLLALTNGILEDATAKSRAAGHCQQYLHHDPNPYSHEYTIGMTWREAENTLYKNIWMKADTHETIMGTISEQNKRLPAGSETRRLVRMWIDRLVKHRQNHPFDAADILGSKLSKYYNLFGDFGLEETRAIESSFLQWSGVPKREVERFFTFCEQMLGGKRMDGPIPLELLRTLASPGGALEFLKNMTQDEAQMFLGISQLMMSPNASETIEHLQAKFHGLNIAKK